MSKAKNPTGSAVYVKEEAAAVRWHVLVRDALWNGRHWLCICIILLGPGQTCEWLRLPRTRLKPGRAEFPTSHNRCYTLPSASYQLMQAGTKLMEEL
jgi:hypothetical protein